LNDFGSGDSQFYARLAAKRAASQNASNKRKSMMAQAGVGPRKDLPTGLRKSVGKPGQTQFTVDPEARRSSRLKKKNSIRYTSEKKRRKELAKARNLRPKKTIEKQKMPLMLKLCWLICLLLALRLVFMQSGFVDYYKMATLLQEKKQYLVQIDTQNEELLLEIKKINSDASYQKKLARDHLSVIAADEYLVLFAKERELSSK
jgi:cell division protein FtsB